MKGSNCAVVALTAASLAGCGAVARSTGAMPLGPDTYRVSARASLGNVSESQRMALSDAKLFCESLKKELLVIGTERVEAPGGGPFEVTFRCLASGDPALVRPTLERAPDTVIQVR